MKNISIHTVCTIYFVYNILRIYPVLTFFFELPTHISGAPEQLIPKGEGWRAEKTRIVSLTHTHAHTHTSIHTDPHTLTHTHTRTHTQKAKRLLLHKTATVHSTTWNYYCLHLERAAYNSQPKPRLTTSVLFFWPRRAVASITFLKISPRVSYTKQNHF